MEKENELQPITMEEMNQLHNEWWASLSNEEKEKLYNDQEKAFNLTIEDIRGPNSDYGV
jgi:hypothetical protein|tara:strand:- start:6 stop:182 length:177 start_codon:yes stop_codon:yes gene_type:complete